MTDILSLQPAATDPQGDTLTLGGYAQQAYLEYALSVVKGRALPDVCDGMKPVQRRILYAMQAMGLGYGGANGTTAAKPVKSARVVGDVLGRFHPHGDQSAYDALVRLAQDFNQRYPLIDGQGNFGSRDGDGAAAMRYTEARLAKIATLLLDEIDEGTVDFVPNYDGSTQEPRQLPARLPFALLNGASGIAVGLATEIPSHNLGEVAAACVALAKDPQLSDAALSALIPGPDYPGGGQIISSAQDIAHAYRTGRGSLKVRARWVVEELARGQWQLVVTQLPPGVSSQKVLEEIEELSNPKLKAGKKALTQEQQQLKATVLNVLDGVRDESSKDALVRLVLEPKSSKTPQQEFINTLLAHTSLETSAPINLTMVGIDGRPTQKSLRQMLEEWLAFRQTTLTRRSQHQLDRVQARIHILEGRQVVLLHIDEVIAIIRESDEPKAALMARFDLSERQAEDILEIRLRQLARLEAIKIDKELQQLREDEGRLLDILANPKSLQRLLIKEVERDAKTFADPRRTLIEEAQRVSTEIKVVDEPVTVVISEKGWVRALKGHDHAPSNFSFKAGDALWGHFACRSVDTLIAFGNLGRVYSVAVATLPGGRGDGVPIQGLIDLEPGTHIVSYFAGAASTRLLLSGSGGYGFIAEASSLVARNKAGKAFVTIQEGETLCLPSVVDAPDGTAATHIACLSSDAQVLTYPLAELKVMTGGRGLQLMKLADGASLVGAAAYTRSVRISGTGRGGKEREEVLEIRSLNNAAGKRASKGKAAGWTFKPVKIERIE